MRLSTEMLAVAGDAREERGLGRRHLWLFTCTRESISPRTYENGYGLNEYFNAGISAISASDASADAEAELEDWSDACSDVTDTCHADADAFSDRFEAPAPLRQSRADINSLLEGNYEENHIVVGHRDE